MYQEHRVQLILYPTRVLQTAYGLQQEQKLVSIPAMHGGTCNLDTRNTKRCTYMGCDPVPCVQTETTAPECLEIPGETCVCMDTQITKKGIKSDTYYYSRTHAWRDEV